MAKKIKKPTKPVLKLKIPKIIKHVSKIISKRVYRSPSKIDREDFVGNTDAEKLESLKDEYKYACKYIDFSTLDSALESLYTPCNHLDIKLSDLSLPKGIKLKDLTISVNQEALVNEESNPEYNQKDIVLKIKKYDMELKKYKVERKNTPKH